MVEMIVQAIRIGAVFLFGSTGETVIEKSGHLNLGIPGTMCLGAVGGCIGANLAYNGGASDGGVVIMAMLMAMLFAGLFGLLYGFFTITLRCNQNVTRPYAHHSRHGRARILGAYDGKRRHNFRARKQMLHGSYVRRSWR